MKYHTRFAACSLLLLSPAVGLAGKKPAPAPQVSPTAISPGAAAFLDNALDIMRKNDLHSQGVDWTAVRTEAFKRAGGAFNPIDTYPAIYWALVQLGDSGSHLRLPPGLYPDQIALLQQAEKDAQSSAPGGAKADTSIPTPFISRRLPEGHIVTVQGRNFGYLVLPRCSAKDNDGLLLYAADVRRLISDLSAQNPKGWIVDLRGNTGGNMWPMLTGIGPILGDGAVGSFVAADGNVTWFYQDGKTGTRNPGGLETVSLTLNDAPVLMAPATPVAVLVDSSTASSAEAITIAFHGRPDTRFFGTHTAGKSTAVQPFKLDDGAELYLTTAIDADRSGRAYPDGFTPDEVIPYNSSSLPQESNDAVLQASVKWLSINTTPEAPPPAPAPLPKTRHRKGAVPKQLAAEPAKPSATTTAAVAPEAPASTPAAAAVEAPAAAPAAPAPAPPAPAPAPASPAPAPAAATVVAAAPQEKTAPAAEPAQEVASTTPATPPPPAPKPKVHKKIVVHQGS
ncbi:MAG TPA: S41 family peptidase [Acidobacteriaceae bacterium]|nr:S41 family peptidase [Acidobacteriaceae bacterium]